jgi:hypothetical protein
MKTNGVSVMYARHFTSLSKRGEDLLRQAASGTWFLHAARPVLPTRPHRHAIRDVSVILSSSFIFFHITLDQGKLDDKITLQ